MYGIVKGRCGACAGEKLHFDGIVRVGVYTKALSSLVLKFKNGGDELESVLGPMVRAAAEGSEFFERVDTVAAVPLHWRRRLRRGYNQSSLLAKYVAGDGRRFCTDLVRVRYTKQQPAMASAASRRRNVAGAFAVRRDHRFAGRRVLLVDDVKTTGATLSECAKVLKQAGAAEVFGAVVAVAGS